jgi:glutaredoxin
MEKKLQNDKQSLLKLKIFLLMVMGIAIIQVSSAAVFYQDGTEISGDKIIEHLNNVSNVSSNPFPVVFFFNTYCGSCQGAIEYLNEFRNQSSKIPIEYHDLDSNQTNSDLLNQYKNKFNTQEIHYPVIFIGNIAICGSDDIKAYAEPVISWYQKKVKTDPLTGLLSSILSIIGKKQ